MLTFEQLKFQLELKFPQIKIEGTAEQFTGETVDGLWVSGETVGQDDRLLLDYYNQSENYVLGVDRSLDKFLQDKGFFVEAYDPGTWMIWRL